MKATRAKLFRNGGSQAVRLPKECRFARSGEVLVRREGQRVILEAVDGWSEDLRACLERVARHDPPPEAHAPARPSRSLRVMPEYMLDTDTVSFALRGHGRVASRLLEHRPSQLCISSISLAKLRFGTETRRSRELHRLIGTFVESVEVAAFDQGAADRFGAVALSLARRGTPIGAFDALIAAHALSLRLTFVTNNTRHFARVPGLNTENWL